MELDGFTDDEKAQFSDEEVIVESTTGNGADPFQPQEEEEDMEMEEADVTNKYGVGDKEGLSLTSVSKSDLHS